MNAIMRRLPRWQAVFCRSDLASPGCGETSGLQRVAPSYMQHNKKLIRKNKNLL